MVKKRKLVPVECSPAAKFKKGREWKEYKLNRELLSDCIADFSSIGVDHEDVI